ncbi:hypothetical protein RFI_19277 [Reticulomyxa filosa]|uniref:Uncharacterized protein n=1 Tax=Reticulomyxa filosa TaxID=46433 RepID=X6MW14_RETFI|nr:hypothetical protein RFI_19277 [Reticulomyxa filosa]|eukprot:ETO18014.1 hypothetical protein RFI_19277 [Reticulomyxa filosa]
MTSQPSSNSFTVGRMGEKTKKILEDWKANANKPAAKEERKVRRMEEEEIESAVVWTKYETTQREVGRFDPNVIETRLATSESTSAQKQAGKSSQGKSNVINQKNEEIKLSIKNQIEDEGTNHHTQKKKKVKKVIKTSNWQKDKVSEWTHDIIEKVGELFSDKLPRDKVYKYAIDVLILQSTPVARQSETVMTPLNDFVWNLKIKNGNGITVVLNAYAFQVATAVENDDADDDATPLS